ncbi:hypothetical protein RHMOL_Rhmol03G0071100 [Rhododendron molle]|uniref:Uncharacterized protein n=1 Tax=Rhododendron molle TaxID=49168 RepID=A0ACC0PB33_RHOML|nr:hypothetical protein RHMOL_Rhmol03G0071100 [Rhododendron molle]
MVLCSEVYNTVLHTSEPSDRASDSSDLISTTNDQKLCIVEMRSEFNSYSK